MKQEENAIMNAYTVIFDGLQHLGPGDPEITRKLAERLVTELPPDARVADFGCGTGASTLILAEYLPGARILAVDMLEEFIAQLNNEADNRGLKERICAVTGDMGNPPSLDGVTGEFDLIWCESAIYSIGRSNAISSWRPLLKPGGWLVFSEIVWNREPDQCSAEVATFWQQEYPGITTVKAILDELDLANYMPHEPVYTGSNTWSNYYEPLRKRIQELAAQKGHSQALLDVITGIKKEIEVYDQADDEVAVVFFLATI